MNTGLNHLNSAGSLSVSNGVTCTSLKKINTNELPNLMQDVIAVTNQTVLTQTVTSVNDAIPKNLDKETSAKYLRPFSPTNKKKINQKETRNYISNNKFYSDSKKSNISQSINKAKTEKAIKEDVIREYSAIVQDLQFINETRVMHGEDTLTGFEKGAMHYWKMLTSAKHRKSISQAKKQFGSTDKIKATAFLNKEIEEAKKALVSIENNLTQLGREHEEFVTYSRALEKAGKTLDPIQKP